MEPTRRAGGAHVDTLPPLRVAAVHDLPTGGALRVMAEWLARTEAEQVTVYTRNAAVHDFVGLPPGTAVIERPLRQGTTTLDEFSRLWRSPREGARFAQEIDRAGYDVAFCFASGLTEALDVLPFLRTPNLFYAPEPLRSANEPVALATYVGWRAMVTRLGLNPLEIRRRQLDRRYIRAAQHIVTHSRFTHETLQKVYDVNSEIVPLGVDAHVFTPPPDEGQREGYVLSVGALHPLKGHEQVIEALGAVPQPRPRLVVIGDRGDAAGGLHELARSSGVELDVRIRVSAPDLLDAYRRAGVVVCAQIREPFGLVPLEAMACATPVIAVAEGGFLETVIDQKTGLLTPRDVGALGGAVTRVLTDDGLAQRLGSEGRRTVESEWSWDRTTAQFDRLLAEIAPT